MVGNAISRIFNEVNNNKNNNKMTVNKANKVQQLEALKFFKREVKIHKSCIESIRKQDVISDWDKSLIDRHKSDIRSMLIAMEAILELK